MRVAKIVHENLVGSYFGLNDGVDGIGRYPGRALAITGPRDLIVLPECLSDQFSSVLQHYLRAGVRCTKTVIWTNDLFTTHRHEQWPGHRYYPFKMTTRAASWSGEQAWGEAVKFADNKNRAIALFKEVGASHPETICFTAGAVEEMRLVHFDGDWRFKPACGATNIGQGTFDSLKALLKGVPEALLEEEFQLQRPVRVTAEGSVQLRQVDGRFVVFAVTGQYVGRNGHEGNFMPFTAVKDVSALIREAKLVASRLDLLGLQEYCSLDFLVDDQGRFYYTEINPRRTGATTPCVVAEVLGAASWSNRLVKVEVRDLVDLELDRTSLCYNRDRGEGVLLSSPFLVHPSVQKAGVMLIAPPDRLSYWRREAAAWLQSDVLREAA